MNNAKNETRRHGYTRPLFCLILVVALIASIFALSGTAVDTSVQYDVKIVSCFTHTAALSEDGTLYVWGKNDSGQFPGSSRAYSESPIETLTGVKDVAVSQDMTFVVNNDGRLYVYGINPNTKNPASEGGDWLASGVEQVVSRYNNYAFITSTGALYMGGDNDHAQLGVGDMKHRSEPALSIESGVSKVSIGRDFVLALTDAGELYGWGSNSYSQLTGDFGSSVLKPALLLEDIKDISAGLTHSCAVENGGALLTCGGNAFSQTGVDTGTSDNVAKFTKVLSNVDSVSSGSTHNFAMTENGDIYTWGYGVDGQMASPELVCVYTPEKTDLSYVQIFSGDDTGFGITADGDIYSWGANPNYLLAKTNSSNSTSPSLVLDTQMNWLYSEEDEAPIDPEASPDPEYPEASPSPDVTPTPPAPEETPEETPVEKPEVQVVPFIAGGTDGSIRPEEDVTRAEFVKMVVAGLCEYDETRDYGTTSFSDVPLNRWFENYVAYAELNELVGGYPDGTFKPNAPITRQEAAKIVAVAMKLDTASAEDAGFTDVSGWSAPYINALAAANVMSGDGTGKFDPKDNITRAEAVKTVVAAQGFNPTDEEIALLVTDVENPFIDVSEDKWYYVYILASTGALNTQTVAE